MKKLNAAASNWNPLVHKCCNAMSSVKVYFFYSFLAGDVILLLEDDSHKEKKHDLNEFLKEFNVG